MTREERHIAVLNRLLENMDVYDSIQPTTERKKAIKAAIQALSQEPMREFTEEEAKAYSKALDRMYKPTGFNVFNEPCDDAISRILKKMWNCRGKHTTSIDKVAMEQIIRDELSVTQKPIECDDAISRQAVLDGLKGCMCEDWVKTLFATMVKQLPSVTQKSGKWIRYKDNCLYNQCSYCGASHCREDNYCPNCGAKMVEPQERSDKECTKKI